MYVLYVRYVRSFRILRSSYSILCDLGYYSSLHSSIGSILDRAYINQLASSDSSPSSHNIILKASVIIIVVVILLERDINRLVVEAREVLELVKL